MMSIKKYFSFAFSKLSLVLLVFSVSSQAQTDLDNTQTHEKLYQVELIVFSRHESNPQEYWPKDVKLGYPENIISLKDSSSSEIFSLLPASECSLSSQAAALARSGTYTLLYHQAWRQMIYGRKTNIAINGGKNFGNHQELEGSISLNVGQYLKIQTNLWLTQFAMTGASSNETWLELPSLPGTSMSESGKAQDYVIKRIVKIEQDRSMRSNEIHYIDHPLLGIIVKIFPYDASKTN